MSIGILIVICLKRKEVVLDKVETWGNHGCYYGSGAYFGAGMNHSYVHAKGVLYNIMKVRLTS